MQGKKQSSAGIRPLAHFFLLHFGRVLSWTLKVLRCPCIWLMKPDGKERPWEQVYSSSCYKLKSRIAGLLKLWMKRKQKHPHPQGGVRCPRALLVAGRWDRPCPGGATGSPQPQEAPGPRGALTAGLPLLESSQCLSAGFFPVCSQLHEYIWAD